MRPFKRPLFLGFVAAMAATTLLPAGCSKDSVSPTEPVPTVPTDNIAGAWTGTYTGVSEPCSSSVQASFRQAGSTFNGTMTVSCLVGQFPISGTLQGNTLSGYALWGDPEFYPVKGTLSGSSLEITIFLESGVNPMGELHLHR
jgi:hypothetical protein